MNAIFIFRPIKPFITVLTGTSTSRSFIYTRTCTALLTSSFSASYSHTSRFLPSDRYWPSVSGLCPKASMIICPIYWRSSMSFSSKAAPSLDMLIFKNLLKTDFHFTVVNVLLYYLTLIFYL